MVDEQARPTKHLLSELGEPEFDIKHQKIALMPPISPLLRALTPVLGPTVSPMSSPLGPSAWKALSPRSSPLGPSPLLGPVGTSGWPAPLEILPAASLSVVVPPGAPSPGATSSPTGPESPAARAREEIIEAAPRLAAHIKSSAKFVKVAEMATTLLESGKVTRYTKITAAHPSHPSPSYPIRLPLIPYFTSQQLCYNTHIRQGHTLQQRGVLPNIGGRDGGPKQNPHKGATGLVSQVHGMTNPAVVCSERAEQYISANSASRPVSRDTVGWAGGR